jgi:hypothetical protein
MPGAAIGHESLRLVLRQPVAAVQIFQIDAASQAGFLAEIPADTEIEITGSGYNERTAMVTWLGQRFFVFLQDLANSASTSQVTSSERLSVAVSAARGCKADSSSVTRLSNRSNSRTISS